MIAETRNFADIYSQTIAYGMFAARYHDPHLKISQGRSCRTDPKTNPFLRKLFNYILDAISMTELNGLLIHSLMYLGLLMFERLLMSDFGKVDKKDPVIHFYENFLAEYDPSLRKARGGTHRAGC
ncbi:hypothetical protein MASR2M39_12770 [Ignavibacteriales bacterium]